MPGQLRSTKERSDQREHDLQALLASWNKPTSARAQIAGRPKGIAFVGDPQQEFGHVAWGYRPRADIVGDAPDGTRLVIELKLGEKYEPLGLAEVLFHAERLSDNERAVRPVLITQYNLWNRVVIDALHRRSAKPLLDYYEVTVVDVDNGPCFWFDAPLAGWKPDASPPAPVAELATRVIADARDIAWLQAPLHWHHVDATDTYVAAERLHDRRPPVLDFPHLMVAPIEDGASTWLAWAGVPPTIDAVSAQWSENRYWVCPR